MTRQRLRAPARRPAAGFTLLSVLISIFVMAIGLLGMVRTMLGVTAASTQNQTVSSVATMSNGFWSITQLTPTTTVASTFPGTYDMTSDSAIAGAPALLQPWLRQGKAQLPQGRAVIAINNSGCVVDCALTLTLSWVQAGAPGSTAATRSQTFYFALSSLT